MHWRNKQRVTALLFLNLANPVSKGARLNIRLEIRWQKSLGGMEL